MICSISSSSSLVMTSASRHNSGVRDSKRSYIVSDSSITMSEYSGLTASKAFSHRKTTSFRTVNSVMRRVRSGTRASFCERAPTKQISTLLDTTSRFGKTVGTCVAVCWARSACPRCGNVMTWPRLPVWGTAFTDPGSLMSVMNNMVRAMRYSSIKCRVGNCIRLAQPKSTPLRMEYLGILPYCIGFQQVRQSWT